MVNMSVIICTYNRCESLKKTLESLLGMVIPEDLTYEIIVVDNNSSDRTRQTVEEVKGLEKHLRYIFEENQGKSFALNTGIINAKGRWIAFLDDDVLVDKNWLNNLCNAFKRYECGAIQGKILLNLPKQRPKWLSIRFMKALAYVNYGDVPKEISELVGANMAFRAEIFEKFGSFDTSLGPGTPLGFSEESELSQRIKNKGAVLLYCPEVLVFHTIAADRLTRKAFRKRWYKQGRCSAYLGATDFLKHILYTILKEGVLTILDNAVKVLIKYSRREVEEAFYYECRIYRQIGFLYQFFKIALNQRRR